MSSASKRPHKRFHWADGLALLLAVVLFLGAFGYYLYSKREPAERVELICLFLISDVDLHDWEIYGGQWFSIGDSLYSSNGTVELGVLESVEERARPRLTVLEGIPTWESHPFLINLEIVVRISATYLTGDGLRAGDLRIAAGQQGDFRFGNFLVAAQILEVREVGEDER